MQAIQCQIYMKIKALTAFLRAPSSQKVEQHQVILYENARNPMSNLYENWSYPGSNLEGRASCAQHVTQHPVHGAPAVPSSEKVEQNQVILYENASNPMSNVYENWSYPGSNLEGRACTCFLLLCVIGITIGSSNLMTMLCHFHFVNTLGAKLCFTPAPVHAPDNVLHIVYIFFSVSERFRAQDVVLL